MIRCKVSCWSVLDNRHTTTGEKFSETVTFGAVYSDDPNSENRAWAKATPCLNLSKTIDNPAAWGKFQPGKEYYLDFTPAD